VLGFWEGTNISLAASRDCSNIQIANLFVKNKVILAGIGVWL
jgi:hypothetical protein